MGNWSMEDYTVEKLSNEIDSKKIKVPKYQRGTVWNNQQKERLIDSMNKGFPFGSILLYKNDKNEKQIIDGLQRSTTIIDFVRNPAQYFMDDNIDENMIYKLYNLLGVVGSKEVIQEELMNTIREWVKQEHKSMQDIQRMQYSDLYDAIENKWPTASKQKNEIKSVIKEMFVDFQNVCERIASMQIPALVYEGDESLLPEIFERINSQGSKLTKQQIYSATWANDYVKITNQNLSEIITNNRDRYDNMLDENMELIDYNSTDLNRNKEVNIFELVFGFGRMISKKYPYLFNYESKDLAKVESIGFNLINACLMQKSANMKNLNSNFKKYIGLNTENVELFLNKIIEAIDYVDKRLGSGTKFKGNTRADSKIMPLHTEMQIVSIIATVFVNRHTSFEINEKGEIKNLSIDCKQYNSKWAQNKDKFNKNILKIYSMDIIAQKWKGSGDKKLDNILIDNYYYFREIPWKEFEQVLDVYYTSMNSERNERKQVASPKEADKIILNLIYASIFSAADQNNESNFDIEHLAPKNLMKEKINNYSDELRLPISSIGNLCLLPQYDNRTKKDKTIYQDKKYIDNIEDIQRIEAKYTFTIKSDFAWLELDDLTEDQFKNAYMKFLDARFNKMKEKIQENLF